MKKEKSCGIIVFNNDKVLVIKHNMGHWGMPKGHVEIDETEEETAMREVFEETGITAQIIAGFKEKNTYSPMPGVLKDVYYFIGESNDNDTTPQHSEVSIAKYVSLSEALNLITYESEKKILEKAIDYYKELKKS